MVTKAKTETMTLQEVEAALADRATARTILGHDYCETPIGVRGCWSVYGAGDSWGAQFGRREVMRRGGTHMEAEVSWSSERGWETWQQARARMWESAWASLKAADRDLVVAVLGEFSVPAELRQSPTSMVRRAKNSLVSRGLVEPRTCGRCGGSGHYSYNAMDGTTCYGCGGRGKKLPSTTDALRAARRANRAVSADRGGADDNPIEGGTTR